ncbi:MAG: phosphatidyl-myo-inositol alpha-mannosyltransferase [Actinomycetota bacterium]|jgi:phosphatidylinositol alpha-mannosyltransferase|nr:phosphatidyl-myo-inositol alpha-mannosyltransferase [Actinomycetota bacterium]
MRVAMICPYSMSRPGGVQGQVLGLARELRQLDVDVRIVAPCDGPPPDATILSVGPTVEWESNGSVAPISPGRATARRTAEALRTLEPDVVHLHEPIVPGPTVSALIGFNGPMVGTFHAAGEVPYQWLRPALRSLMMRLTYRVAVSESARETAAGNWTGAEYTVLWNGIEIERVASATPAPAPRPTVLFIGRHEPRKGLEVLIDAWAGIERDARLQVVGVGQQTEELQRRAVGDVEWFGTVTDVPRNELLRGATAFCAPSLRGESFGVVLLEAMAAGAPIVASAIEGYQNVARPGKDALLVPPGDVDALRDALRRLLDDSELRARLVASGRERAEQFSMRRLAQRYVELYERALVPTG